MTAIVVIGAIVAVGALYVVLPVVADAYRRFRGTRLVTCPETHQAAAVEVNARRAAFKAAIGRNELSLRDCSRWPEREDCGQECLRQIEVAPEDCLVRTMLTKWYQKQSCALCTAPFEGIESWGHRTALMKPDGTTVEWGDVRAETLPDVLATSHPVCWNCHIAASFRRQHPDLVIDRPTLH